MPSSSLPEEEAYGLSSADRLLLRAYFGFARCKQMLDDNAILPKSTASPVIQKLLWSETDNEDDIFDFETLQKKNGDLSPILPLDTKLFAEMIKEAKKFTTSQKCAYIKTFAVSCFFSFLREKKCIDGHNLSYKDTKSNESPT